MHCCIPNVKLCLWMPATHCPLHRSACTSLNVWYIVYTGHNHRRETYFPWVCEEYIIIIYTAVSLPNCSYSPRKRKEKRRQYYTPVKCYLWIIIVCTVKFDVLKTIIMTKDLSSYLVILNFFRFYSKDNCKKERWAQNKICYTCSTEHLHVKNT